MVIAIFIVVYCVTQKNNLSFQAEDVLATLTRSRKRVIIEMMAACSSSESLKATSMTAVAISRGKGGIAPTSSGHVSDHSSDSDRDDGPGGARRRV